MTDSPYTDPSVRNREVAIFKEIDTLRDDQVSALIQGAAQRAHYLLENTSENAAEVAANAALASTYVALSGHATAVLQERLDHTLTGDTKVTKILDDTQRHVATAFLGTLGIDPEIVASGDHDKIIEALKAQLAGISPHATGGTVSKDEVFGLYL